VLGNVAFGLELQDVPKEEREQKAREILELVGLENEADSGIDELSGGQQQRVGLARALATEAGILLMDEAFSALDPLIRTHMQSEFLELQKDMPRTILFITHDLGEALSMGDRIAIMKDGAVVQIGTPEEIILKPADDYVASFVENVDRSRVLTVGAAAHEKQPRISPGDSVQKALEVMRDLDLPYAFVMENDDISGAVRLRDAEQEEKRENPSLENIIMPPGDEVRPEENLISILAKASGNLSPLPVIDESGELVGAITKDDLLRAVAGEEEE
jgi:glycine betaine/proline transport system ATP-binding protein